MAAQKKRWALLIGIPIAILLIPFIAMQFTSEINWTTADFIIAAALLFSTSLLIGLTMKKLKEKKFRILAIMGIILLLLLIWIELAVGIFGSPWAGN